MEAGKGYVVVEIEKEFEDYFNGIFLLSDRVRFNRDDIETHIPKRIFGNVLAAPRSYIGPNKPITYTLEDIDDAPRLPANERYGNGYGNQHPVFRELGMGNAVTIVPVHGTHGKCYYEGCIQDFLEKDDTVWFSPVATEKSQLIGKNIYAIPVNQILAYKRGDGKFTPFGGKVFLLPVKNKYHTTLILPESVRTATKPVSGLVFSKGLPLYGAEVHGLINQGDEVEFPKSRRWELEINGKQMIVVDAEQITRVYARGEV